jgi:hypothetical protein
VLENDSDNLLSHAEFLKFSPIVRCQNKIKGRFFAPKENKRVIRTRAFVNDSKEKIIVKFYVEKIVF